MIPFSNNREAYTLLAFLRWSWSRMVLRMRIDFGVTSTNSSVLMYVGARCTDVGELLGLADVDDKVVVVHMLADDLSHVHLFARVDEELTAILQLVDGIGIGRARLQGNHRAVLPSLDVAFVGLVFLVAVGHDGFAL